MTHVPSIARRSVVVLTSGEAPQVDLCLVRSLGAAGLSVIVIGEQRHPLVRVSRHCSEFLHVPRYTRDPAMLRVVLTQLRARHREPLPVLPSSTADLWALMRLEDDLGRVARCPLPGFEAARRLLDRRRFAHDAAGLGFPVPRTHLPATLAEVAELCHTIDFPVVVRPAWPRAWQRPGLEAPIAQARALPIDDPAELMRVCCQLAPGGLDLVIQEHVPGPADAHASVQMVIGPDGRVLAKAAVRRWAGVRGVGVGRHLETVHLPVLEEAAATMARRLGLTGLATFHFKRHAHTGRTLLLGITPCLGHAAPVLARGGLNLAWLAWQGGLGGAMEPAPARVPREGLRLIDPSDEAAGRPGLPGWRVLLAMLRGWLAGDFVSVSDPDDPRPGRQWLAERIRGRWPGTSLLLTWFGLVPGTPPDLSR